MPSASQIRQTFMDFFVKRQGHTFVPSSPCVPHDDPTLLFTNAGMNQFKPLFLGTVDPKSAFGRLKRAANSQKCIRAGGKHNDLEDVGRDTYHHTFFEMLGNWSFGDYFKKDAIRWSYDLLTQVFSIDPSRLYATYFGGNPQAGLEPDLETKELWCRYLPADHVLPGNMKDNFWEMGDTGPCGPCSEVHYDRIGGRNAARLVNAGDPDVLEIWNNVFIQFNREADGTLKSLPAKHVDTGMGFERLVSVLQNKRSNYDTDVFAPYFEAIRAATGARPYAGRLGEADEGLVDTAYRVIADHIRTLTFAITDGATPGNDGRGYVLRRILRRAVRFGRQMLGAKGGFLSDLVPVVVESMGEAFPELRKNPARVQQIIREEEESFGRTLDRGIGLFQDAAERAAGSVVSAADAFQLYDTFGFPLDLTQLMAEERGLKVDVEGFGRLMDEQRERSRAGGKETGAGAIALGADAVASLRTQNVAPTEDLDKYHCRDIVGRIRAIWNGNDFDTRVSVHSGTLNARFGIVTDRTNFYSESGGQVSDRGTLRIVEDAVGSPRNITMPGEFHVEEARAFGGYVLHIGRVARGELRLGSQVTMHVDSEARRATAGNHTATHLLNLALRTALGEHVDQKGSLVNPERLRFDFSNPGPVPDETCRAIESAVRSDIGRDLPVYADIAPLEAAKKVNTLRAVFGEKYPDPVRVVSIGARAADLVAHPDDPRWMELSVEFCGGTHVPSTGAIGAFAIVSETGIAKGIRRIEALSGVPAQAAIAAAAGLEASILAARDLPEGELAPALAEFARQIEAMTLPLSRRADLKALLAPLHERLKAAAKAAAKAKAAEAASLARDIADKALAERAHYVVALLPLGEDRQAIQQAAEVVQAKCPGAAVMIVSPDPDAGKVAMLALVPKELLAKGLKAGDWVREASAVVGGKGGGRPEQAQGGGTHPEKAGDAAEIARAFARRTLGL
ncbi:MAG: alanine--tRNA ligase [Phycisphaerales bacterium]|nr:alanine--tRNA ligase [Phycisphaerales bacterium]